VLLEESNLSRVADPAAGSGAFEALTEQLCLAAWTQFQEIEQAGGAWPALESGLVQRNVAAVRAARQQALAHGKEILTGTNAYPDITESLPAVLAVTPRAASGAAAVSALSLPRLRLAEPFEALRDKSDRILAATGARPKVFLATLGAPADFTARANFAANFFEAGGIEAVIGTPSDYRPTQTAVACLCSSSRASEQELASAAAAIKRGGARHIYFTGRLGAQEDMLRAAGVQTFIDQGSDALATLNAAYDILQQKDH
jgi:methylmalonyl-CoA mutase